MRGYRLADTNAQVHGTLDKKWDSHIILGDLTSEYLLITCGKNDFVRGPAGPATISERQMDDAPRRRGRAPSGGWRTLGWSGAHRTATVPGHGAEGTEDHLD